VGSSALTGALVAIVALALAGVLGFWWRRRDGRIVAQPPAERAAEGGQAPAEQAPDAAVLRRLGVAAGTVTLLQFSSAFCAPCRVARRICADLADRTEAVTHVEVDAESHLDEVRALGVWRTPTVLVVDAGGRIAFRLAGAPSREGLTAVVDSLVAGSVRS
jgi:thiol-disulfide isomerase/thioredoxin